MRSTIFDDVFRTIQERLPKLLVPLVNEVFHTSYSQEIEVERLPDEYQKLVSKVVADSCSKIGEQIYHFECQSTKDGNMVIRMIEYDFMIALMNAKWRKKRRLKFPKSSIIYLRSTKNTVSEEWLEIELADGQVITYRVPVLKLRDYSIDEIFEKNLLILLPYYIIKYEKELSKIAKDAEREKRLLEEYGMIIKRLEGAIVKGQARTYRDIIQLMKRVMEHLLRKEPVLKERMGDVMGGKVLPLPSDALREAEAIGLQKGISSVIRLCREMELEKKKVIARLKEDFSLTDEQAKEAIVKYW
ncbi:MAG: hypothetical protein IKU69_01710 [Roseburia sp.]|nr:hypothetical protein [Roseburia sp.]